jgi:hypothetical protein
VQGRYIFGEVTDLVDHTCVQCLDMWETRRCRKVRKTRAVKIYCRARMDGGGYVSDGRSVAAGGRVPISGEHRKLLTQQRSKS